MCGVGAVCTSGMLDNLRRALFHNLIQLIDLSDGRAQHTGKVLRGPVELILLCKGVSKDNRNVMDIRTVAKQSNDQRRHTEGKKKASS